MNHRIDSAYSPKVVSLSGGALLATPGSCKQFPSTSCGSVSAFSAQSVLIMDLAL
jgi:hypothetical protein